jgi:hypothetical protein
MNRVNSRQLGSAPPIDRRHLDRARRPFRVLLGATFVGYSSIGTIVGVQGDLAPALASTPDGATIGLIIGFGLALAIFLGEILLAEAALFWYLLVLAPDAWYTYRFSSWIGLVLRPHLPAGLVGEIVIVVITAVFSLLVAYFGERLLFGKRR